MAMQKKRRKGVVSKLIEDSEVGLWLWKGCEEEGKARKPHWGGTIT